MKAPNHSKGCPGSICNEAASSPAICSCEAFAGSNDETLPAWRPIAAAPRDGAWFLVYSTIRGIDFYRFWGGREFGNRTGHEIAGCTHWMPLPPPPTNGKG